jgi:hypothetical protein
MGLCAVVTFVTVFAKKKEPSIPSKVLLRLQAAGLLTNPAWPLSF